MNLRSRNFLVVVSLVLLLCVGGAGIALASPDGDDDPGYNAAGENGFGTQYSIVDSSYLYLEDESHPVTTQDTTSGGAGSSVTAVLVRGEGGQRLQLTRYDKDGIPVSSFGEDGISVQYLPDGASLDDLLDIRVLSNGTIRVLARGVDYDSDSNSSDLLWVLDYTAEGDEVSTGARSYESPDNDFCEPLSEDAIEGGYSLDAQLNAARVGEDGDTSGLWTCDLSYAPDPGDISRAAQPRGQATGQQVQVAYYPSGAGTESDAETVPTQGFTSFGEDLELGPDGDPYVLTGTPQSMIWARQSKGGGAEPPYSQVFHYRVDEEPETVPTATKGILGGSLVSESPTDGSDPYDLPGLPVDLAVDSAGRPLVWTENADEEQEKASTGDWGVYRLTSELSTDTSWGTDGKSTISDPRLDAATSSYDSGFEEIQQSLTVRPDDRVLVTGSGNNTPDETDNENRGVTGTGTGPEQPTEATTQTAIIAGLTSTGGTDTGFGDADTPGFRAIDYTVPPQAADTGLQTVAYFDAIGEPKVQTDGKVLVPHTSTVDIYSNETAPRQKIAGPPSDGQRGYQDFVGVTRLRLQNPATATPGSNPSSATRPSSRPVRPSSTKVQCGRRVISLVRADVRGGKIRLTGLVGSKLYGKKVTIETNPTAVKASAYSKTATVTASKKTGAFTATVTAPKRSQFKTVRYRAKSGRATSPVLKLPQSLTSRSVKSAKGTITVKGQVKRSVLGKRNSVKIRRLVCGRYRTVAVVKPAADGSYTATFKASKIRGVSFYRAEIKVQVKPGSKKYAIQYARAIAIRTTSQTG